MDEHNVVTDIEFGVLLKSDSMKQTKFGMKNEDKMKMCFKCDFIWQKK